MKFPLKITLFTSVLHCITAEGYKRVDRPSIRTDEVILYIDRDQFYPE
jgi:hypothetical protein